MPETRVTIGGRVHRLDIEHHDKAYLLVEVECTAEGTHSTKNGDVPTRKITVTDAFKLTGDLPVEMAEQLRGQRRQAEEAETGIDVIPGLEGFLDGNGVVVTESDRVVPESITETALAQDEADAIDRWVACGEQVHSLIEQIGGNGPGVEVAQLALDGLWSELNSLTDGDVVEDGVIIDEDGNERAPIELPDFASSAADSSVPFEGYEALGVAEVLDHVDQYLDADSALGGPSPESRAYVASIHEYELAHKGRAGIGKNLEATLAAMDDALGTQTTDAIDELPAGEPWDGYDKSTADSIIGHLKGVAERDGDDAVRPLIPVVEAYETAGKNRKGILGRLATIVPPILPDGPDLDLELDEDDEFEPDDEQAIEDTADISDLEE